MRRLEVFVISLVFWLLLAWPWGARGVDIESIAAGVVVAGLATVVLGRALSELPAWLLSPVRWFWLLCYVPVFAWACVKANLQMVYLVLHPDMPIKPGIVRVHTKLRSETGISALANSITLTPGTLTVDADEDGTLFVHWIYVEDETDEGATREIVGRFEGLLSRITEEPRGPGDGAEEGRPAGGAKQTEGGERAGGAEQAEGAR